jgi:hypothetical protein
MTPMDRHAFRTACVRTVRNDQCTIARPAIDIRYDNGSLLLIYPIRFVLVFSFQARSNGRRGNDRDDRSRYCSPITPSDLESAVASVGMTRAVSGHRRTPEAHSTGRSHAQSHSHSGLRRRHDATHCGRPSASTQWPQMSEALTSDRPIRYLSYVLSRYNHTHTH